jgi:hypothetical protein
VNIHRSYTYFSGSLPDSLRLGSTSTPASSIVDRVHWTTHLPALYALSSHPLSGSSGGGGRAAGYSRAAALSSAFFLFFAAIATSFA